MRLILVCLAVAISAATASAAAPSNASAQLFAERTALLAGDAKCALLAAPVRSALTATTGQARTAALREGWTQVRLDGVAQRAAASGAARRCADAELIAAARSASAGFKLWSTMHAMDFNGAARAWTARRTPDPSGFTLVQHVEPAGAFGIESVNGKERLILALPDAYARMSATVFLRDRARAPRPIFDVPGMPVHKGLAGAAPPRSLSRAVLASARALEPGKDGRARVVFAFPDSLLGQIAALDPREAIRIELTPDQPNAKPFTVLIEVGDLAVACAFLSARPA